MKCLSVRQPWSDLILDDSKIEIRSWFVKFRGKLLIHASSKVERVKCKRLGIKPSATGAIIGIVDLFDIERLSIKKWGVLRSRHFLTRRRPYKDKTFGWFFENPKRFTIPIPFSGSQGLFNVPDKIVRKALQNRSR